MLPVTDIPHDVWRSVFLHISWKDHLRVTMRVCSLWNKFFCSLTKSTFLDKKKCELHKKMLPFLNMAKNLGMFPNLTTLESMEHYCPIFQSLKTTNSDTMKIFIEKYEKGLQMEKYFAELSDVFYFSDNPQIQNIQNLSPEEVEKVFDRAPETIMRQERNGVADYILKRNFVKLCTLQGKKYSCEHQGDYASIFPMEIFNLRVVQGGVKENPGVYCFPFKGKLIKILVTESCTTLYLQQTRFNSAMYVIYMPQMHALSKDYQDYIAPLEGKEKTPL